MKVVECVPNFSEGTDASTVDSIVSAVGSVDGAVVLDVTRDVDHNRSVVTFAGNPPAVREAAFRAIRTAAERIDMRKQSGVHPRIGAADVVPFVPVQDCSLGECVAIAHDVGRRVWEELRIPVYFYEAAALRRDRQRLENIRRGQFEILRDSSDAGRNPDLGGPAFHESAGATVIGARKFLIAWNVNLDTADVSIAREIAKAIRESSGGLQCVKALGLYLASRNVAQVSMNLTHFEVTSMQTVIDRIEREAEARGVAIQETEIIGLLPRAALAGTAPERLHIRNFRDSMIVENRIADFLARGDTGAER